MKRSAQRILTTHVGNLIRPASIVECAQAQATGKEIAQMSSISRQHREIVRAKLDALAEGAALASRRLWQKAA